MKPKFFFTSLKRIIISLIIILSTLLVVTKLFNEADLSITFSNFSLLIIFSFIVDFVYLSILSSIGGRFLKKEVPKYVNRISSFFEKAGLILFGYSFDECYKAFNLFVQNGRLPDINNLMGTVVFLMISGIGIRVVYVVGVTMSEALGTLNLRKKGFSK